MPDGQQGCVFDPLGFSPHHHYLGLTESSRQREKTVIKWEGKHLVDVRGQRSQSADWLETTEKQAPQNNEIKLNRNKYLTGEEGD